MSYVRPLAANRGDSSWKDDERNGYVNSFRNPTFKVGEVPALSMLGKSKTSHPLQLFSDKSMFSWTTILTVAHCGLRVYLLPHRTC